MFLVGCVFLCCTADAALTSHHSCMSCESWWLCECYWYYYDIDINRTPLNRGTAAIPLLCLSHEKHTTHCTPCKWWFIYHVLYSRRLVRQSQRTPCANSRTSLAKTPQFLFRGPTPLWTSTQQQACLWLWLARRTWRRKTR